MNCRKTSYIAFATLCLGLLAFCQGCASERTSFDYECAVRTCNIGPFEYRDVGVVPGFMIGKHFLREFGGC